MEINKIILASSIGAAITIVGGGLFLHKKTMNKIDNVELKIDTINSRIKLHEINSEMENYNNRICIKNLNDRIDSLEKSNKK